MNPAGNNTDANTSASSDSDMVIPPSAVANSTQNISQASVATIPLPMPVPPSNPETAAISSPQSAGFQVADDKDIIEPAWVNRAKHIVLTTREDPYKQSEDLTAFKADYMQKRYNKVIKLK